MLKTIGKMMNPCIESCSFVDSDDARYVFVNHRRIQEVAEEIALENFKTPSCREEIYPEDDNIFLNFLGVSSAINFCFWNPEKQYEKFNTEYPWESGQVWLGSDAMNACLLMACQNNLLRFDPEFLASFSIERAKKIFVHKNIPLTMLKKRVKNIVDIGRTMKRLPIRDFQSLFELHHYKFLDIMHSLVRDFHSFDGDCAWHRGRLIKFFKRAQLLLLLYHGRAITSDGRLKPLVDPENFGVPVDYQLPKALRILGIIFYDLELAELVDNRIPIQSSSVMEIEIRARTVNAMMKTLELINERRCSQGLNLITMLELDHYFWRMGRNPEFKMIPHHLTVTTAY